MKTTFIFEHEKKESRSDARSWRRFLFDRRARGACEICTLPIGVYPFAELHHIIPVARGGKGEPENLIILCPNCHATITVIHIAKKKYWCMDNQEHRDYWRNIVDWVDDERGYTKSQLELVWMVANGRSPFKS